jgi:Holliday junction resolvase RusA-like endonuclease
MPGVDCDHRVGSDKLPAAFIGYDGACLVAELPFPPSTNHLYFTDKYGKRRLTKEGKLYKQNVQQHLMEQRAWKHCPRPPFELSLHYYLPDHSRRDLSNLIKAVEDALSTYLHYDDSCHYAAHQYKAGFDKPHGRVVIVLEHLTEIPDVPLRHAPGVR